MDTVLQWPQLEILRLRYNRLTGTLPTELAQLTNLRHIIIKDALGGSIPSEVFDGLPLERLYLEGPNWNSTIPENIGKATSLGKSDHLAVWDFSRNRPSQGIYPSTHSPLFSF